MPEPLFSIRQIDIPQAKTLSCVHIAICCGIIIATMFIFVYILFLCFLLKFCLF